LPKFSIDLIINGVSETAGYYLSSAKFYLFKYKFCVVVLLGLLLFKLLAGGFFVSISPT